MASARYGYLTVSPSDNPSKPIQAPPTSLKRTRSPSPPPASDRIFESSPLHDRKSTFQGFFSPALPPHDLQHLPSFSSASHKILAYRIPSRQSTLAFGAAGMSKSALQTGHDDDGEQYAAKHVARVLGDLNVVGSLVVARWYGGVMLGPVRFKHIEDVAREAVKVYFSSLGKGKSGATVGAGKVAHQVQEEGAGETQAEEMGRLVRELKERDESILSLRKLLEQKKVLLGSLEGKSEAGDKGQPSPTRKMDYTGMDLKRLRAMDQARDKTIAFLLKQIDETEEKIVALNALDDEDDDHNGEVDADAAERGDRKSEGGSPGEVAEQRDKDG
ncbi:hypothetical protein BDZ85DRAFT_202020 [Elsinoe ampelina]|uniref:Impact N-terminal domain-containing protein n=1 Tax=Elsinoe ampelina TaxID=302913 RepID=A0A6A6G7S4_9PEZI|nr:hypothetical protein BDZ85DRAFT_202020 [Elsinoe ampelina]